jgi:uroporphyrinogen-III decarboxylase
VFEPHDGKVGYFSKHPFESEFFMQEMNNSETKLAGIGVDQNKTLSYWLNNTNTGFIQGNFSPEILSKPLDDFKRDFDEYIGQVESISEEERTGVGVWLGAWSS